MPRWVTQGYVIGELLNQGKHGEISSGKWLRATCIKWFSNTGSPFCCRRLKMHGALYSGDREVGFLESILFHDLLLMGLYDAVMNLLIDRKKTDIIPR